MGLPTSQKILDAAERLIQTRGYNGFSYADLSEQLRIRKASIHHHFRTKEELGLRLVARYRVSFARELKRIERDVADAPARLRRYVLLYEGVLADRSRMCLCGMLAAEITTLPRPVQAEVRRFFQDNERWLVRVIQAGVKERSLPPSSPTDGARILLTGLEGAMMVARCYDELPRFRSVARGLLQALGAFKA
jgi:TetR/AcrR family transcriptional repressor of nem operon